MTLLALLGLLLPGYLFMLALGLPGAWAAAFPLSSLLLAEIVIGLAILGAPLRIETVLGLMGVFAAVCAVVIVRRGWRHAPSLPDPFPSGRLRMRLVIAFAGLVTFALLARTTLYPLSGPDTIYRWEALARLMLEHRSLAFYPPVSPSDYRLYIYPDGLPPLVASVYWLLYAALGQPLPAVTSIPVTLQFASTLALVWLAVRPWAGTLGSTLAVVVLAGAPGWIGGVGIGQETGFTALAVAGQLAFVSIAAVDGQRRVQSVVVAGLFAALGGLAREYGPALAVAGFALLLAVRRERRLLGIYALVFGVLTVPWFVRNAWRSGNPFHSIDVFGLFPVNPVHAMLMSKYRETFGLATYSPQDFLDLGLNLLRSAPIALVLGLAALAVGFRRLWPLALTATVAAALWLWSIGYTAGGLLYSMRVLTPAWVALATASAFTAPALARLRGVFGTLLRAAVAIVVAYFSAYGLVFAATHPTGPAQFPASMFSRRPDPLVRCYEQITIPAHLRQKNIPPCGMLTDDCYLAIVLQRRSKITPVMIWSPDVDFIFNPNRNPTESNGRLRRLGIPLVMVWFGSWVNSPFLGQFPFYREGLRTWVALFQDPQKGAIFYLPPEAAEAEPRQAARTGASASRSF